MTIKIINLATEEMIGCYNEMSEMNYQRLFQIWPWSKKYNGRNRVCHLEALKILDLDENWPLRESMSL